VLLKPHYLKILSFYFFDISSLKHSGDRFDLALGQQLHSADGLNAVIRF